MKFTWKGHELVINQTLAYQLMSLVYNIDKDWDFVILITGDRMVRVGKSVLGLTICAFLAYCIEKMGLNDSPWPENADHVFFDNTIMLDEAQRMKKFSILDYDEAREGLAANKAMMQMQKDLIDFFTECGQMNHIFVLVAPDFFELKEFMAVGRSEILINVYRRAEAKEVDFFKDGNKVPITAFRRGYFEFFSRKRKQQLYDKYKTTGRKSYGLIKADFIGTFTNQYPINEEEYRKKKLESLQRFKNKHKDKKGTKLTAPERNLLGLLEIMDTRTLQDIARKQGKPEDYFEIVRSSLRTQAKMKVAEATAYRELLQAKDDG